jgi:hypothetical protein
MSVDLWYGLRMTDARWPDLLRKSTIVPQRFEVKTERSLATGNRGKQIYSRRAILAGRNSISSTPLWRAGPLPDHELGGG